MGCVYVPVGWASLTACTEKLRFLSLVGTVKLRGFPLCHEIRRSVFWTWNTVGCFGGML